MGKALTILSDASAAGGLAIGLSQIYNILGIVLTVLSILVLIANFCFRMYDRLKDGKFTNEERADAAREILELTEKITELQNRLSTTPERSDGTSLKDEHKETDE